GVWIAAADLEIPFNFYLDPLSAVMALVVTGVGLLIHIYAAGYMAGEGGYYRFFAYMNLFLFFMLTLVLAGNYLLLFVGWEGVGLCSYLLIGFYFRKDDAADAGKKAFLVTRIGDFGFLIALLLLYWTFDSLNFAQVLPAASVLPVETDGWGPLTLICLLLLMGVTGKSAQVPLYVWLPDAMLGPTPVSALIHAATMVTAGVYIIARSAPLYVHAPDAMFVVALVGGVTALYAATIGVVQNDIKRVLAYSTISQIGYMVMACGVAAFSAAIFHLMTHAFFKALLFLGAGSVIHALGGEQDIRKMGGLRRSLPRTYWTFLAACLALAALWPFAGFFSKDEILWEAYASPYGGTGFWLLGLVTAGISSFYIFRLFFLTFHGNPQAEGSIAAEARAAEPAHTARHPHESPPVMTWPLIALAALSFGGGWMGSRFLFGGSDPWSRFIAPAFQLAAIPGEQVA
ncbi:MAG: NADH-quinone oxidoreductase subunit L, partial [Terriglobia bacterium]